MSLPALNLKRGAPEPGDDFETLLEAVSYLLRAYLNEWATTTEDMPDLNEGMPDLIGDQDVFQYEVKERKKFLKRAVGPEYYKHIQECIEESSDYIVLIDFRLSKRRAYIRSSWGRYRDAEEVTDPEDVEKREEILAMLTLKKVIPKWIKFRAEACLKSYKEDKDNKFIGGEGLDYGISEEAYYEGKMGLEGSVEGNAQEY